MQRQYAFAIGTTNGFADSVDRVGCKWTKDGYQAVFSENGRFTYKARTETPIHPRWKRDMEDGCVSCAAKTMRWEWQCYYYDRKVQPEEIFIDSDDGITAFWFYMAYRKSDPYSRVQLIYIAVLRQFAWKQLYKP